MNETAKLVERLRENRNVGRAPTEELEWLIAHATFRAYQAGEVVAAHGTPASELIVVLSGRIVVQFEHGTGQRHMLESRAGSVTGVLPYSRMGAPIADAVAVEPTEILAMSKGLVPDLIRECPQITTALVHLMLDRARTMNAANWLDEKTLSLGRLAAGLSHELNNPASAALRSAKLLRERLGQLSMAARALGAVSVSDATREQLFEFIDRCLTGSPRVLTALERADLEDELSQWLEAHRLDAELAGPLSAQGVESSTLDQLVAVGGTGVLPMAVSWIAASANARSLLDSVEGATGRVHDLVSTVRRFSYLDRAGTTEPTDIVQGLADTVTMWTAKAAEKGVRVDLTAGPGIPPVMGSAGLLNQVWSNLVENAIDAAPSSGSVQLSAERVDGSVVVRVIDNGPGIPTEVQARMFDPFFTTKPVGKGMGLGLDIARRVVLQHEGRIEVSSLPGRTELCVTLPATGGP